MIMKTNTFLSMLLSGIFLISTNICLAGYDEGLAAYRGGDFASAVLHWQTLAEQGDARAQHNLGVMYEKGHGVPMDKRLAVSWHRKAAASGNAYAQNDLGAMYEEGIGGVPHLKVVAYALYNLSSAGDSSENNKEAKQNRIRIEQTMSKKEIHAAQDLSSKMAKPGEFLKALDKYSKKPKVKEVWWPVW